MSNEHLRQNLRAMVRGSYDLQKLRIQTGLRLVATLKTQMGIQPGKKETEAAIEKEAAMILGKVRADLSLISDWAAENAVAIKPKTFKGQGIITEYSEYLLAQNYLTLHEQEVSQFALLQGLLKEFPIYTEFLDGVKGCGPAMGAVLISEIDIHKARYPSSLWMYAGLDVASDGRGRTRQKEHLVKVQYQNKDKKMVERDSITFNPFLKTKLMGVLAAGILKAGIRNEKTVTVDAVTGKKVREVVLDAAGGKIQTVSSPYAQIYLDYKNRLNNRPDLDTATDARKHNMATRYMIKMFLIDLHREWRALEGLEASAPYHVAKLGMRDHYAA